MIVHYFLSGRKILESVETDPPRRGDEVCLEGKTYSAWRVVRHMPMCPPDHVHVHLVLAEPEEIRF